MARINLLPWREQLRNQRKREFGFMVMGALVLTVAGMGYWHWHNSQLIAHQKSRNSFLKTQIARVDKQIAEIANLERTRGQLIARMRVIQDLQISRPQIVHLFDEMVRTLPDGVYLTSMTQVGGAVALEGRAESNARVSAYMRNVEASPWLGNPTLGIIQQQDNERVLGSSFRLSMKQIVPKAKDEG